MLRGFKSDLTVTRAKRNIKNPTLIHPCIYIKESFKNGVKKLQNTDSFIVTKKILILKSLTNDEH